MEHLPEEEFSVDSVSADEMEHRPEEELSVDSVSADEMKKLKSRVQTLKERFPKFVDILLVLRPPANLAWGAANLA